MSAMSQFEEAVAAWADSLDAGEAEDVWRRAIDRARLSGQRPAWLARADLTVGLAPRPTVSTPALAAIVVAAALLAALAVGLLAGGAAPRPRLGVAETALPVPSAAVGPVASPIAPFGRGAWRPLPAPRMPGSGLTATALVDGRLLVAGPVAILFDPVSGQWTQVDPPHEPRRGAVAARLVDGRALLVGGVADGGDRSPLATAELFDPSTGHWSAAGSMTARRAGGHTATTLLDGRVLVAAGTQLGLGAQMDSAVVAAEASAELFDPRTGDWTPAGRLNGARSGHTATLLEDGRVLVTGGRIVATLAVSDAELFDPVSGRWTVAAPMASERFEHAAVRLDDGSVLVTGGYLALADDAPSASAERYDPATDAWSPAGTMALGRYRATATRLPDGTVLVVGGSSPAGPTSTAELYDPTARSWTAAGAMGVARTGHAAVLMENGWALVVGGGPTAMTTTANGVERFFPDGP